MDRPISIERVEFLDRMGSPTQVCPVRGALTVRLHYHAREAVELPLFSFAIETASGQHLATARMFSGDGVVEHLVGDGYVDYQIETLSLAPGDYVVSFAVHDQAAMVRFDYQERAATLHVQPGDRTVVGLVDLLGRWDAPVGPRRELA